MSDIIKEFEFGKIKNVEVPSDSDVSESSDSPESIALRNEENIKKTNEERMQNIIEKFEAIRGADNKSHIPHHEINPEDKKQMITRVGGLLNELQELKFSEGSSDSQQKEGYIEMMDNFIKELRD